MRKNLSRLGLLACCSIFVLSLAGCGNKSFEKESREEQLKKFKGGPMPASAAQAIQRAQQARPAATPNQPR
jgi:uncharacterized lipoprotein YehR (DUF1307 family)